MIIYLIKSGLCLGLVLGGYQLVLEREKMLQFNRWFLLAGLCFSFIVPLISLEWQSIEVVNKQVVNVIPLLETAETAEMNVNNDITFYDQWSWLFGVLYLLITLLLGGRFFYHLRTLLKQVSGNGSINYQGAKLVLLKENGLPYTFLNYIFVSEDAYRNNQIEQELYTHELAHANQLHTLDVLVVELLQTLFWINPFLPFYKKAIQLNHEFLADDKVIKAHQKVKVYQHLLLDKIKSNNSLLLTSNFNFLLTKKRLKMMTKNTSWGRSISLASMTLPLFFGLLLLFSKAVTGQDTSPKTTQELRDAYYKHSTIVYYNEESDLKTYKPYTALQEKEKALLPRIPEPDGNNATLPKGTAVYINKDKRITIKLPRDGAIIPPPPPPPAPPAFPERAMRVPPPPPPANAKMVKEYNTIAKKYSGSAGKNKIVKRDELMRLMHLYELMTEDQKKEAVPFPSLTPVPAQK
ncbi:M56 family metallopeptidase [Aureispira anguillae]|uniref:Peptidase M56 domain-containing protein n=1 Tax=Aureispira anguillae TaxID=2864201 RepID=A0A916DV27_9BACT|nr:M56 family metallopeptidase [Aureispira anguillae]BDS13926.1 hypothetical protein AsAng_0046890 [Aureispira anguillae]